jgi:hypothetical protein
MVSYPLIFSSSRFYYLQSNLTLVSVDCSLSTSYRPCGCSSTDQYGEDGKLLYYDAKPMSEGRLGLGLYKDSRCRYDYTGSIKIAEALQNIDLASQLQFWESAWNDAFDVYKVCQPCRVYNLGYNEDLNEGEGDRTGGDEAEGYSFNCYDETNIKLNQCTKFKTNTKMLVADFHDLMLAHEQRSVVEFKLQGHVYGLGGYTELTSDMSTELSLAYEKRRLPASTIAFSVISWSCLILGIAEFISRIVQLWRTNKKLKKLEAPLLSS